MSARPSSDVNAILDKLVGFDTTSDKSNLGLIEWVRLYLAAHGVEAAIVPNETGDKALRIPRNTDAVTGVGNRSSAPLPTTAGLRTLPLGFRSQAPPVLG